MERADVKLEFLYSMTLVYTGGWSVLRIPINSN